MYSEEMKKVMRYVRGNIRIDRETFNKLSQYHLFTKADLEYKRTYTEGIISGAFVFSGIRVNEYNVIKKYIAWEYRRLERIYFK